MSTLAQFRDRGFEIALADGDRIRVRATNGALTPQVKAELRARKPEIVAELRREARLIEEVRKRLRKGQAWLTETLARLDAMPDGESVSSNLNRQLTRGLDVWECGELTLRNALHFRGCIHDGGHCPADAVIRCAACVEGGVA